jgi:hypothetical protein
MAESTTVITRKYSHAGKVLFDSPPNVMERREEPGKVN